MARKHTRSKKSSARGRYLFEGRLYSGQRVVETHTVTAPHHANLNVAERGVTAKTFDIQITDTGYTEMHVTTPPLPPHRPLEHFHHVQSSWRIVLRHALYCNIRFPSSLIKALRFGVEEVVTVIDHDAQGSPFEREVVIRDTRYVTDDWRKLEERGEELAAQGKTPASFLVPSFL